MMEMTPEIATGGQGAAKVGTSVPGKAKRLATALGCVLMLGLIGTTAIAQQGDRPPIGLETTVALGNVKGRIDHLAVDLARKRLFIAELENNSLGIVDLDSGTLLHRIGGLSEPQGVGYIPATDTIVVANGRDGTVRFFRGEDFAATAQLKLGEDADNVRVSADPQRVYIGYGSGALAVIDPVSLAKTREIALPAHPESFQVSRSTQQIFVNLPRAHAIAVVDRDATRPSKRWATGKYRGNYAMALDEENQRIVVAYREPAKLSILDMRTGAKIAGRDTCGDVDDVFTDAKRQRVYVTCGEGFIDVFDSHSGYRRLARIATRRGARTSLFIPALDRLAVAVRASETEPAALWIYRASP
jgi:DNA-binding beta-propeller fold protein YncE